jgi:hypothetical protein
MTAEQLLSEWYRKSRQISPVRIPRLNRKRLVQYFGEWGLNKGAEIGVDGGTFSEYMFKVIPGLELIGVDPWLRDQGKRQQAWEKLKNRKWTRHHMTSLEAAPFVPDGFLDFVYIDGDHRFDYVMLDLILWAPKVHRGGVIAGHDYYRFRDGGVVPAVDCYTREHGVQRWFVTDEKEASFFWVKDW